MLNHSNVPHMYGLEGFIYHMNEDPKTFPSGSCLADYIDHWLWSGRAMIKCFGDFEIFLKTIPLIVDAWYRDPTILHYAGSDKHEPFERFATSAFGETDVLHPIFDRDHFKAAVFIWQHLEPK